MSRNLAALNLETKILQQYKKTKEEYGQLPYLANIHHMCSEREKHYKRIMGAQFRHLNDKTIFEIGAGTGDNLFFFQRLGIYNENIYANEMIPDRIEKLKQHFKHENVFEGNILDIKINRKFDIVF